jgi:predicted ABC-type ATPase
MPVLTVVAGPNGSGKSSILRGLEFEGRDELLEADAVAKRINPADPGRAAVSAAREVISRTREYLKKRRSFALETTLASGSTLATMRQAQARGFVVRLVYVCLDHPERSIQRVRERVALGGHDVPDSDVRRRFHRSLLNLPAALQLVHQGVVYENSEAEPRKVLETQNGAVVWQASGEPAWVSRVREVISSAGASNGE